MRSDDLKQPVNRREFLESTGRCAAALGLAGATLAPGCRREEEPPAPVRRPVVDTHMHVWANDPVRYPFPHPYIPDFKYADIPAEGTTEMLIEDMDRNGVTHSVLVQARLGQGLRARLGFRSGVSVPGSLLLGAKGLRGVRSRPVALGDRVPGRLAGRLRAAHPGQGAGPGPGGDDFSRSRRCGENPGAECGPCLEPVRLITRGGQGKEKSTKAREGQPRDTKEDQRKDEILHRYAAARITKVAPRGGNGCRVPIV